MTPGNKRGRLVALAAFMLMPGGAAAQQSQTPSPPSPQVQPAPQQQAPQPAQQAPQQPAPPSPEQPGAPVVPMQLGRPRQAPMSPQAAQGQQAPQQPVPSSQPQPGAAGAPTQLGPPRLKDPKVYVGIVSPQESPMTRSRLGTGSRGNLGDRGAAAGSTGKGVGLSVDGSSPNMPAE